jgi:hypothetical protein
METTITNAPLPKKSKWKRIAIIAICLLIISLVSYIFICGITYSSGARTGIVLKISQKGFLFKTYEGELNLGGISEGDGTIMPTRIWNFSVDRHDTAVYNALIRTQGKHMRLYYKEVMKNFFWQSDTPYIIQKAELVN